nr:MAG TPA: hypothetical protein [Caudoviricetes sp.]
MNKSGDNNPAFSIVVSPISSPTSSKPVWENCSLL